MKKLWETKAFSSKPRQAKSGRALEVFSTYFLTVLLAIFLLIVVGILVIVLWTSNGGSDQENPEQAFYNPSASSSQVEAAPASSEQSEASAEDSAEAEGETIAVLAGEGAGSIAARAGISIERLYELNPDKMTGPGGTWWANPGDMVKIK